MLAMDVWCFSKSTIRVDLEKHQTRLHYWGNSLCNFEESPLQLWGILLYNKQYKVQAVKLAKEIGGAKAAKELGIPEGTIHTWLKAVRAGKLDVGEGSHTPASAMSLSEEITMLRKRVKEQDKEIRRLKEENEFLEEASAFFAASRRKSAKTRE